MASLEKMGVEICISSDAFDALWLVAEHTGQSRNEMTFRDAATLAALCAAFPHATVTSFQHK